MHRDNKKVNKINKANKVGLLLGISMRDRELIEEKIKQYELELKSYEEEVNTIKDGKTVKPEMPILELGLSIGSPDFEGENLEKFLQHVGQYKGKVKYKCFGGDSIQAHGISALYDTSTVDDCVPEAMHKAKEWMERNAAAVKKYLGDDVEYIWWSNLKLHQEKLKELEKNLLFYNPTTSHQDIIYDLCQIVGKCSQKSLIKNLIELLEENRLDKVFANKLTEFNDSTSEKIKPKNLNEYNSYFLYVDSGNTKDSVLQKLISDKNLQNTNAHVFYLKDNKLYYSYIENGQEKPVERNITVVRSKKSDNVTIDGIINSFPKPTNTQCEYATLRKEDTENLASNTTCLQFARRIKYRTNNFAELKPAASHLAALWSIDITAIIYASRNQRKTYKHLTQGKEAIEATTTLSVLALNLTEVKVLTNVCEKIDSNDKLSSEQKEAAEYVLKLMHDHTDRSYEWEMLEYINDDKKPTTSVPKKDSLSIITVLPEVEKSLYGTLMKQNEIAIVKENEKSLYGSLVSKMKMDDEEDHVESSSSQEESLGHSPKENEMSNKNNLSPRKEFISLGFREKAVRAIFYYLFRENVELVMAANDKLDPLFGHFFVYPRKMVASLDIFMRLFGNGCLQYVGINIEEGKQDVKTTDINSQIVNLNSGNGSPRRSDDSDSSSEISPRRNEGTVIQQDFLRIAPDPSDEESSSGLSPESRRGLVEEHFPTQELSGNTEGLDKKQELIKDSENLRVLSSESNHLHQFSNTGKLEYNNASVSVEEEMVHQLVSISFKLANDRPELAMEAMNNFFSAFSNKSSSKVPTKNAVFNSNIPLFRPVVKNQTTFNSPPIPIPTSNLGGNKN